MSKSTQHTNSPHHYYQHGFTLLEVLITVVILSIGILGLAGLQFNALRSNQGAAQSTIAVLQVIDAADRLRGNLEGVKLNSYNLLKGNSSDPECIQTGCNDPAQLAQYDDWAWQQQIANALPDGQGVICLDSIPNTGTSSEEHECDGNTTNGLRIFAVKVWWDDDHNPNTPRRRHIMSITP
ncbi:type IV pilus modification protein PilV [Pseudomonadota bacterium]